MVCYTLARQAPSGAGGKVGSVWVRAQGDVLVRADAIVVLALGPEGLRG